MKWSYKIGSVFGIPLKVHLLFVVLFLYLSFSLKPELTLHAGNVFLFAGIFGSVLVHELVHSFVAIRHGIKIHSITLMPIGGVAHMATQPEHPVDEIKIAIAGPLASFAIAGLMLAGAAAAGCFERLLEFSLTGGWLLSRIFWANVMLGTINLVPAFPMDGGRVLRGFLATRKGMMKATEDAVLVGQAFAVILYFIGATNENLRWLIIIAVFIYIGADQEEEDIEFRTEIADVPARDAMLIRFDSLSPDMTIAGSLDVLRHSSQDVFPVARDGKLEGMVSKNDVLNALKEMPGEAVIGEIMETDLITAAPDEPMGDVFRKMELHDKDVIPVVDGGRVEGLASFDQIGRYYALASRSKSSRQSSDVS